MYLRCAQVCELCPCLSYGPLHTHCLLGDGIQEIGTASRLRMIVTTLHTNKHSKASYPHFSYIKMCPTRVPASCCTMTSHLLHKDAVCFLLLSHSPSVISCYTHPLCQKVVTVKTFLSKPDDLNPCKS